MYNNWFETKEKKIYTKDKIEPQRIIPLASKNPYPIIVYILLTNYIDPNLVTFGQIYLVTFSVCI